MTLATYVRGHYESPIGLLEVRGSEKGILSVVFVEDEHPEAGVYHELQDCMDRLHHYFRGEQDAFSGLPLCLESSDFALKVQEQLMKVPYGKTVTYGDIAQAIGQPAACRAVGTAVGANPLSLVLPCHRVLPASGDVGQYAWGSWRKEWLLQHEGNNARS